MYLTLLWRYFVGRGELFKASSFFSIIGVTLGVSSLVLAMASFSGFESTLKRAVTDGQGDITVFSRGKPMASPEQTETQIWKTSSDVEAVVGFAMLEGLVAHREKVGFVVLSGLPWPGFEQVLSLDKKIVSGTLTPPPEEPLAAIIGKGVAETYGLSPGDGFPFVWPRSVPGESSSISPVMRRLKVAGVVDLGKHELNERTVIAHRSLVQELAGMGDRFSGFYVRLTDSDLAAGVADQLSLALGSGFWVSDWYAQNKNLFSAIELEKFAIFFILQVIMIVACVNVSMNLSTTVLKRYADIALLKALGLRSRQVQWVFVGYGVLVCAIGLLVGLAVGLVGTYVLEWVQARWQILPGDVYRLDNIQLEVRFWDVFLISVATLLIGVVSTWIPARRGAHLAPTEGFRYE